MTRRLLGLNVLGLNVLVLIAAGLVVSVLTAGPAAAHNGLRSTSPAADAAVGRPPAAVVLTFDEPAIAMGTRIVVTGPAGPVQVGEPLLVDNTVTQPLQPNAPAGRYLVEWRVTSADGHPITGRFAFTAAAAGRSESVPATAPTPTAPTPTAPTPTAPTPTGPTPTGPTPTAPTPAAGSGAGWRALTALAVLVLVLAGMLYAFRRARGGSAPRYDRSASSDPPPAGSGTESSTESSTEPSTESRTESRPPTDD